jgi:hypothetical protein
MLTWRRRWKSFGDGVDEEGWKHPKGWEEMPQVRVSIRRIEIGLLRR